MGRGRVDICDYSTCRTRRFAEEARRQGRGQHGAIPVLANFQSREKRLHLGIRTLRGDRVFSRVKKTEERAQLLSYVLGVLFVGGKSLGSEVDASQISRGSYDHGWLGK